MTNNFLIVLSCQCGNVHDTQTVVSTIAHIPIRGSPAYGESSSNSRLVRRTRKKVMDSFLIYLNA